MPDNKMTKRQKLAQKNAVKQAIKCLKRGVGAIQKHPHKGLGIVDLLGRPGRSIRCPP